MSLAAAIFALALIAMALSCAYFAGKAAEERRYGAAAALATVVVIAICVAFA